MSVGSPTAGTWSSSQWRPDNEFETDRVRPLAPPERPVRHEERADGLLRWRRAGKRGESIG